MDDKQFEELIDPYVLELRRGMIVIAVLSRLGIPKYGYSLIKELSDLKFEVDQGTLYPLLRRLEERGLLESEWITEDPRPRKYYRIKATGEAVLARLKTEWKDLVQVFEGVLS
jgi:PadR family transcriptional regulator PadR